MNIDLATLQRPDVVETLDYEVILDQIRAELVRLYPPAAEVIDLESEPLNKLLEVAAYRELHIRARVNDAARAVMLPWAVGADLDGLAARYDVARLPGEENDRLRLRVLKGYHALAAAASPTSWQLKAMSVSVDVRAVDVWSNTPGRVKVCLLARVAEPLADMPESAQAIGRALFGDHPTAKSAQPMGWRVATAADAVVRQVEAALTAEDAGPMTVDVNVTAARVLPATVSAQLVHPPGIDGTRLASEAAARVLKLAGRAGFRVDMTRAAIMGAIAADAVRDVVLHSPADNVAAGLGEVVAITAVSIQPVLRND